MAASDCPAKPFQTAKKMADTAIQLDGGNRHKEAYCEYLRTINYISHALLEDAECHQEKEMLVEERMLRLAELCLEQAKSFIVRRSDPVAPPTGSPAPSEFHRTQSIAPAAAAVESVHVRVKQSKATSPMMVGHRRVLSDGDGKLSPFLPPEVFQRLLIEASQNAGKKVLTPIEEASRLNQKLKAKYEARLARLTPGQANQKTSLVSCNV